MGDTRMKYGVLRGISSQYFNILARTLIPLI